MGEKEKISTITLDYALTAIAIRLTGLEEELKQAKDEESKKFLKSIIDGYNQALSQIQAELAKRRKAMREKFEGMLE